MQKIFKFELTDVEVDSLMWLVEGNNAYGDLARVLQIQIDNQPED